MAGGLSSSMFTNEARERALEEELSQSDMKMQDLVSGKSDRSALDGEPMDGLFLEPMDDLDGEPMDTISLDTENKQQDSDVIILNRGPYPKTDSPANPWQWWDQAIMVPESTWRIASEPWRPFEGETEPYEVEEDESEKTLSEIGAALDRNKISFITFEKIPLPVPDPAEEEPSGPLADATYRPVVQLGRGGQATVDLMIHRKTRELYARKTFHSVEMEPGVDMPRELYFLLEFLQPSHPNIVQLHEGFTANLDTIDRQCELVLDWCDGGDLCHLIDRYICHNKTHHYGFKPIPETFLWQVFFQLIEALAYLHSGYLPGNPNPSSSDPDCISGWRGLLHNDIKPENIFLKFVPGQKYPQVKLGDFGLACTTPDPDHPTPPPGGTPEYAPPEDFASEQGDIWSAGCTMYVTAWQFAKGFPKPTTRSSYYAPPDFTFSTTSGIIAPTTHRYSTLFSYRIQKCLSPDLRIRTRSALNLFRGMERDREALTFERGRPVGLPEWAVARDGVVDVEDPGFWIEVELGLREDEDEMLVRRLANRPKAHTV
ncbi:MAG: hypothetical protein M1834_005774 [Cirrosporium novae-zelandiae]|nr:MAG: hypothetical protein M1834_005774 [Cirrosporium novae-zelandiae]